MIEPTETESKETLDEFCDAMIQIAREAESDPQIIHDAPVTTPVRRLDQTLAARASRGSSWTPSIASRGMIRSSGCSSPSRWTAPPTWRSTRRSCSARLREARPADAPLLRLGAAHDLARLRPAARRAHRSRRRGATGHRPRAAGHGRQRHPPRGPRPRDHLQRGGGRGDFAGADDLLATYRWIGAALERGLRALGAPVEMVPVQPSDPAAMPAFCFARTGSYELEVRRPQARRQRAAAAGRGLPPARRHHAGRRARPAAARLPRRRPIPLAGMTTLEAVLGRRPSFDETAAALAEGFREAHGLTLEPGGLTDEEESLRGARRATSTRPDRGRGPAGPRARPGSWPDGAGRASFPTRRGSAWAPSSSTATACCSRGAAARRVRASGACPAVSSISASGSRTRSCARSRRSPACACGSSGSAGSSTASCRRAADAGAPRPLPLRIIDYVAAVVGGPLQAGSDAAEARWVALAELGRYDTTDGLADMIQRAVSHRQTFARHAKG